MSVHLKHLLFSGDLSDQYFWGKINGTTNGKNSRHSHYFPYRVLAEPMTGRDRNTTILRVMKYDTALEELGERQVVLAQHLDDRLYDPEKHPSGRKRK